MTLNIIFSVLECVAIFEKLTCAWTSIKYPTGTDHSQVRNVVSAATVADKSKNLKAITNLLGINIRTLTRGF